MLCSIPSANGALAPPNKVAAPPVIAPYPIARKHPNPKRLPGFIFDAFTISRTIGNIIAATACSEITKALAADRIKIENKILYLPLPNLAIKLTAILELKPERIIGLARIIALKTKNTVLLAKDL